MFKRNCTKNLKQAITLAGTRWLDRYTGSRSALPCRHRKAAFTLAGTPCFDMSKGLGRSAFTLAEVLITLAIIGVVAAITIPSLMALIGSKSDSARKEVIEDRLLDGLNRYSAMEDGLSLHYDTTKQFLDGLSKYYKMSQICDSDEITKCVPYEKMFYETGEEGNKTVKSTDVADLTTNSKLMSPSVANDYLPPASFISAQGTPVIIALKKDCAWDMGTAMTSIESSGCISLMYDKNGVNSPNKFGSDIVGMGLTPVFQPLATINGIKVMEMAFFPQTGLTRAECDAEIPKASEYTALGFQAGIKECYGYYDGIDRWAAAMKYCKEKGYHLPSDNEAKALVQGLFKDANGNHPTGNSGFNSYTFDKALAEQIGLKDIDGSSLTTSSVGLVLWTCSPTFTSNATVRDLNLSLGATSAGSASHHVTNYQAICIGN